MVAYSFKPVFAARIRTGAKCHTIRAHRTELFHTVFSIIKGPQS